MRSNNRLSILSTIVLLFTAFSAAWPWPDLFSGSNGNVLAIRQDESASSSATQRNSNSASASATATNANDDSNNASETNSASGTASITGSASQSVSGSASRSGSGTRITGSGSRNSTRTTAIDPRLPPGGVSMMTPAAIDGMTFVKVGDQVTFKWNYTSLSVPPSYIDVVATNAVNSQTYTIAANQSWQETQAVTWDTNQYSQTASLPFVVATYTLMVYDSNSDPTAIPSAGYLGAFANLQFGIYTPQPYVPLNEFRCATCSGAMSVHEKQALGVIIGTCVLTIFSFTWFAAGFGAFA